MNRHSPNSHSPFYLSHRGDDGRNGAQLQHVDAPALYFSKRSSAYNAGSITNSMSAAEIGASYGNGGPDTRQFEFPGNGIHHENLTVSDSNDQQSNATIRDPKTLMKLAVNREAARKSRLKRKSYVQELEKNKQRLIEIEQNLKGVVSQQGNLVRSRPSLGCAAFDVEYKGWADEHQRLMNDLRRALDSRVSDTELHLVVEEVMSNYHELFRIKRSGAKSDIFHILSGSWKTPAEKFFMWLGGFRSSDLLKVLEKQIEPLTEQQVAGICNLQQSCQQTEDALSQGIEALQQAMFDTLSHKSLASENVTDYVGQMGIAMTKIVTFDKFLHQADLLRLQTLQQLQRILTVRQTARALLAINDYKSRLRALTSLWVARPKE